jgi:hypothetical protein
MPMRQRSDAAAFSAAVAVVALFGRAAAAAAPPDKQAKAEVVADLLPLLGSLRQVRVQDASAFEVRRPVPANGVLQNAFFLHPKAPGRPARAEVAVPLPRVPPGGRLLLAFDVALSDGIPMAERAGIDGVRFGVDVDGQPQFRADWRECRWQPAAVDLTAQAGRTVRLALLADARKVVRYDWALFGSPRLIVVSPDLAATARPPVCGMARISWAGGKPPARVRLVPEGGGGGDAVEWRPAAGLVGTTAAVEFSFPRARRVRVVTDPPADTSRVTLASYAPAVVLTHVGATQAAPRTGGPAPLRVEVRNTGRGLLSPGDAVAELRVKGRTVGRRALPALGPGEAWRGDWAWRAPAAPGVFPVEVRLVGRLERRQGRVETFAAPAAGNTREAGNTLLRVQFVRSGGQYAYARVLARPNAAATWQPVGTLRPILSADTGNGKNAVEIRPQDIVVDASGRRATLAGTVTDSAGVRWAASATVEVDSSRPMARLRYQWTPVRDARVAALMGPNLYVGDGLPGGDRKAWGLFPGLEYLYRGEQSSSSRGFAPPLGDRRTPDPRKITVPLMAVTLGPQGEAPPLNPGRFDCPDSLLGGLATADDAPEKQMTAALWWDPLQKWDGVHALPSARFGSPNADQAMDNHRMALFLPSVPGFVPENGTRAAAPGRSYRAAAGRPLTLEATLWAGPGPALGALGAWVRDRGGLPTPSVPPRALAETFALSRDAYGGTVWNPATRRWRSIIEGGDENVPGIATLLLLDAFTGTDPATRANSARLAETGAAAIVERDGPGALTARDGCHILRWELPFLYGHLPAAFANLETEIRAIRDGQQPEGGWRFGVKEGPNRTLGRAGDSVSGINSHHTWMLLRHARVTGDAASREAGLRALRFIERFRVPRGASLWECPIYEPDILASAWTLPACLEAWQATGDARWLHDAVYWAETAVPFVYLWALPDKPSMLGASIPIFGTTFYTHSWLATPVQWEGLTVAYHLRRLADALETASPHPNGSPLRPALSFGAKEWRQLAELLTVSGLHQQIADAGPRRGTYPDSITDFVRPNPVFIHPENLLANLFYAGGVLPDIRTAAGGGGVTISTVGTLEAVTVAAGGAPLRFRVGGPAGKIQGVLLGNVSSRPVRVRAGGHDLTEAHASLGREPGWQYDAARKRLCVNVPRDGGSPVEVEVTP